MTAPNKEKWDNQCNLTIKYSDGFIKHCDAPTIIEFDYGNYHHAYCERHVELILKKHIKMMEVSRRHPRTIGDEIWQSS